MTDDEKLLGKFLRIPRCTVQYPITFLKEGRNNPPSSLSLLEAKIVFNALICLDKRESSARGRSVKPREEDKSESRAVFDVCADVTGLFCTVVLSFDDN